MEKLIQIHKFKEGIMEASKMKNMVVLKNLPSNLVEEAIVILKSGKKVKKLEKIEKNKRTENNNTTERMNQDYVLKEAEMLVANYITSLEKQENKTIKITNTNKKYKRLKQYAYISSFIIFIQALMLLAK